MRRSLLLTVALLVGGFAQAAEFAFEGTEDAFWSNVNNWTADGDAATVLPATEDDVRIRASCLLDFDAGTVRSIRIGSGGAGDLTVEGGTVVATTDLNAIGWDAEGSLTINSGLVYFTSNVTLGCWANKGTLVINDGQLLIEGAFLFSIYDQDGVFVDSQATINGGVCESYYLEINGGQMNVASGQARIWYSNEGVQTYIDNGMIVGFGGNGAVTFDTGVLPPTVTAEHDMHPSPDFYEVLEVGDIELSWDNIEPNHPGASIIVDVWFGTDPNKLSPAYNKVLADQDVTGQLQSSVIVNASNEDTYYWQVDVDNGNADPNKIEGTVFVFETTNDTPPIVDAGLDMVTWANETVQLDATITDDGTHTIIWVADNESAVFSDDSIEDPTVTIDNAAGAVTLTLTVDDGFNTPVSDTVVINVFADACQAARDGMGMAETNPEDLIVDCLINIDDFAAIAAKWLDDYALTEPVPAP